MNKQIIHYLDELDSTNNEAKRLLAGGNVEEGTAIYTGYQTKGKGQLQTTWESRKGKNLLLSAILYPSFLPVDKQYYLNRIAALAVCDFLCLQIADQVKIKWPNDVLVNNEKISGILIENALQGSKIENSVLGFGININQTKFQNYIPKATSLYNLTYREFDIEQCAITFRMCLLNRYKQLSEGLFKILLNDFNKLLYRKNEEYPFKLNNEIIEASIVEVIDSGELILKDKSGKLHSVRNKELEYIFT